MRQMPVSKAGSAGAARQKRTKASRRKSRVRTELAIVRALERLLTKRGFEGLGVNAVAETAGVSKELIYRYFGGL